LIISYLILLVKNLTFTYKITTYICHMEEAIKQIKARIAAETNHDVKQGLKDAYIIIMTVYSNMLNQEINNHIKQN
jgi:hypothetical protein